MYRTGFTAQLALSLACLGLSSCQRSEPRVYDEIAFKPISKSPFMDAMNASPVDVQVGWTLPGNWLMKDSSSGMRAGSFAIQDSNLMHTGEVDPNAVDVSVTHFAGDAGGLERNVQRWMGQIGVRLDSAELSALIQNAATFKTQTGEEGRFIDLTTLLSGDLTQDKSIFGAIVPGDGYTLFVKAMGEKGKVVSSRDEVRVFSRSLVLKSESK